MKTLFLWLGPLLTLLFTCGTGEFTSIPEPFSFDAVEYYQLRDGGNVRYHVEGGTPADSLRYEVIEGNTPLSLADSGFVNSLHTMGFTSKAILPSRLKKLREIFGEHPPLDTGMFHGSFCTPVYRDILVFRRSGRITGSAKICFNCKKVSILLGSLKREYFSSYSALGRTLPN